LETSSNKIVWQGRPNLALVYLGFACSAVGYLALVLFMTFFQQQSLANMIMSTGVFLILPLGYCFYLYFSSYTFFSDGRTVYRNLLYKSEYQIRPTTKFSSRELLTIFESVKFDTEVGFTMWLVKTSEVVPILKKIIDDQNKQNKPS